MIYLIRCYIVLPQPLESKSNKHHQFGFKIKPFGHNMLEENASAIVHLYSSWSAICKIYGIHRHLCGEAKFV